MSRYGQLEPADLMRDITNLVNGVQLTVGSLFGSLSALDKLSNEDLEKLYVRVNYLHDRLGLAYTAFAMERKERQHDGRMAKPKNPIEGMMLPLQQMVEQMQEHDRAVHGGKPKDDDSALDSDTVG